ncbi:VOC family protein [Phenylobacterium montanum]|uniref:VOC family protein n=1 Tax=Phenylobacterium montanum TaxID=2823693 RepID=A0A975IU91_9CAUL|nr:VOC family protein [Caulobacter sp. S6]QUD87510.1 VOC family protein [Caulobacter sp. S6]
MAKPIKFAHVVYMTRRYDEMIAWYRQVFEAEVAHGDPVFTFMTYDDEHHRFAFANLDILRPGAPAEAERGEIGVNHVAYTYADVGDLLQTYARLKAAGITPYWPVHHGITLSLYYRDPDGNRMEFQVDCMTAAEANRYMTSEAFAANPAGIEFDPDRLLAQYESGVADEVLLRFPDGAPRPLPEAHGLS